MAEPENDLADICAALAELGVEKTEPQKKGEWTINQLAEAAGVAVSSISDTALEAVRLGKWDRRKARVGNRVQFVYWPKK